MHSRNSTQHCLCLAHQYVTSCYLIHVSRLQSFQNNWHQWKYLFLMEQTMWCSDNISTMSYVDTVCCTPAMREKNMNIFNYATIYKWIDGITVDLWVTYTESFAVFNAHWMSFWVIVGNYFWPPHLTKPFAVTS